LNKVLSDRSESVLNKMQTSQEKLFFYYSRILRAEKGWWDRSLPPPVAETGRRSVGNRKEQPLGCDYAGSPEAIDKPLPSSTSEKCVLDRPQTSLTDPEKLRIRIPAG